MTSPLMHLNDVDARSSVGILPSARAEREYLHHPFAILRVAGLPDALAQELTNGLSRGILDELRDAKICAAELGAMACAALEEAVSLKIIDQPTRRILLKARRNLFNGRPSGLHEHPSLAETLGSDRSRLLENVDWSLQEIARCDERFIAGFAMESADASTRLRSLCIQNENFLKGVAFCSPSLIADLQSWQRDPQKYTGKRARSLDMALFNYFIRATTKVSPLTYFTPVLAAQWSTREDGLIDLGRRGVSSAVEISRRALNQVAGALARNLRLLGEQHPLELNPTIEMDGEALRFRDLWGEGPSNGRTWGVYQPLVKLPLSERIRCVIEQFGVGDQKTLTLRDLFVALGRSEFFAGQPGQIVGFIAKTVQIGLLLPVMDLYEQEDWMAYLEAVLQERMPDAASALSRLKEEIAVYSESLPDRRLEQSTRIGEVFAEVCAKTGAVSLAKKSPLFYEDCTITGPTPALGAQAVGTTLRDMHQIANLFPLLDFNHIIQSVSASLFRRRVGDRESVRATEFSEAIANEAQAIALRMTPLPLQQQEQELGGLSGNAESLLRGKRLLLMDIRRRMKDGADLNLDETWIEEFASYVPEQVARRATSYTVIGQAGSGKPGEHFILNRLYSGHSMLTSRFLRAVSAREVESVADYLRSLAHGAQVVEIPGVFGFNANIHPQFVDAELAMAGRRDNYRETAKIPFDEIYIRYDEALDRLQFLSSAGEEMLLHYFGFLNIMALPGIYQILGRMNQQGLILDLWQDLYFAGMIHPDTITLLPRVTCANVVLSRRSFFIPPEKLPDLESSEAEFFRGMHALLRDLGQTADHYVRLVANRDDFFADEVEGRGNMATTTDFKPAYLSLDLPLSISGLKKRLQRRRRSIVLQEALPAVGDGGIPWNGLRHACELQFEIARTREDRP